MYKTNTIETTIIDQIDKFLKNCFDRELEFINSGKIKINTNNIKIAGIISSNPIF